MASKIDKVNLDALISERYVEATMTTDHPVEEGADPTDHIRVAPGRLTIEAMITNTPTVENDRNVRGQPSYGTIGFAGQQYEALRALRMGKTITVQTPARKYENMQMTEIARSRDSKLGVDSIVFTAQFKEIVFVSTQTVALERVTAPTANPKKPTAKEQQAKKPTTEDTRSVWATTDDNTLQLTTPTTIP